MPEIYEEARDEEFIQAMAETIAALAILAHGRGLAWTRDALCEALRTLRDEAVGPPGGISDWR